MPPDDMTGLLLHYVATWPTESLVLRLVGANQGETASDTIGPGRGVLATPFIRPHFWPALA
jgi:hypothetical protein